MYDEHTLLRRREVEAICAISRSEIYRLMAEGKFPRPVRLGPHMVRWTMSDIVEWLVEVTGVTSVARTTPPPEVTPRLKSRRPINS